MKVAIVGAGLGGLSCAFQLEKYNIDYTIFERNGFIGEGVTHVSAFLNVLDRSKGNGLKYFNDKYGLKICKLNDVHEVMHYGPNVKSLVKRKNMGQFMYRGRSPQSYKVQLFKQLKNPKIYLNTIGDPHKLSKEYDHVVLATGDPYAAIETGCWQNWIKTIVKGVVIEGNFNKNRLVAWVNKDYCKKGYAYLTPISSKLASLVLIVTDIHEKEINMYWNKFIQTENIHNKVLESFVMEHITGYCYPQKLNNIYFVGNSSGGIDPFLGFGQLNSITQGLMSAVSIAENKDFYKLTKDLVKRNMWMYELRKKFNNLTNDQYDMLIKSIKYPVINQVAYHTDIDLVKFLGKPLRLISKLKDKIN